MTALLILRGMRGHRSPSTLAALLGHAGLSIAFALRALLRHLVALMSGTLQVSSQPGQGSAFSVELPFHHA